MDIWACGVMLYAMVCGQLPFSDANGKKTFDKIIAGQFSFPPKIELSKEVRDLITKILNVEPKERLTGADILTHPWVLGNKLPFDESDEEEKEEKPIETTTTSTAKKTILALNKRPSL